MKRRRRARRDVALVAVAVLRREVRGLSQRVTRLEGRRRRIGFRLEEYAEGDRIEQDEDDPDVPDEVP